MVPMIVCEPAPEWATPAQLEVLQRLAMSAARQFSEKISFVHGAAEILDFIKPPVPANLTPVTLTHNHTPPNSDCIFVTPLAFGALPGLPGGGVFSGAVGVFKWGDGTLSPIVKLCLAFDVDAPVPASGALYLLVVDESSPPATISSSTDSVRYFDQAGATSFKLDHRVCRVAIKKSSLLAARLESSLQGGGQAALIATFDRLARALTGRRVGLALAGGGALSFYHAAVIQELESRSIPIDVVAGVSGGALVGAYYCALGSQGLTRYLDNKWSTTWMALRSFLSVDAIAQQVDRDLGGKDVRLFEVPLTPLTVNILAPDLLPTMGPNNIPNFPDPRVGYVWAGNVGRAVQMSGSLPGAWGVSEAEISGHLYKYIDGAAGTNIPIQAVLEEGADIVIVSLAVPRVDQAKWPWPLRRVTDAFDGLTATTLLMSQWHGNVLSARIPMSPLRPLRKYHHIAFDGMLFWDAQRIYTESGLQLRGEGPYPSNTIDSGPVSLQAALTVFELRKAGAPNYPL